MRVMHCIATELVTMFGGVFTACWKPAVVTVPVVEVMIHMPVEMFRSVEPGAGADEHASREPLRAVVTVGSTVIRRDLVISVRADRWLADSD